MPLYFMLKTPTDCRLARPPETTIHMDCGYADGSQSLRRVRMRARRGLEQLAAADNTCTSLRHCRLQSV